MPIEAGKIRNVAVVGHRGTGKTSLVEAMLFQAGAINRLGNVEQGSTTSDWDEDEQRRQMSLASSLCHLEWQGRKINLIDNPGDAGFSGDTIAAMRVVEGALVVASAVMGVEVQTSRVWDRAESLEGTIAAYDRVRGLKEIVVVRGPHSMETWPQQELDRARDRMVAFAVAAVQGRTSLSGTPTWMNLKELMATSADVWEPSSRPR